MIAILPRRYEPKQTFGSFLVLDEGEVILNVKTLELPYLQNKPQVSCIPPGEYWVDKVEHEVFGTCFLLNDVPNREGIYIHIFNYATGLTVETRGCIAPGLHYKDINSDGNYDISDSKKAMNLLRAILPSRFKLTIL